MRYAARFMRRAWSVGQAVFAKDRQRRRRLAAALPIEQLEPRLALAITVPIQDASGLAVAGYDVWVSGHGIPGWQDAGASPLYLMSLGSGGSFVQTAMAIQQITSSGTTATVTTQAPHGLTSNDTVFVAGASVAGYDGSYQTVTVPTATSFTYTTPASDLAVAGPQGTVYTSALLASTSIHSAESVGFNPPTNTGLATVTTLAPHGLSVGQTVEISGVSVAGYNGVFSVGQTPTATTFQVTYSAPAALANGTGGTLTSAGIVPVKVATLANQSITLDDSMTNISARLFFFVAASSSQPAAIPLNGISPSDPTPPPFGETATLPSSIFDIVEFAYLPTGVTSTATVATYTTTAPHGLAVGNPLTISGVADVEGNLIHAYNGSFTVATMPDAMTFTVTGTYASNQQGGGGTVTGTPNGPRTISPSFSTFDVSAVDGLAVPLTLTASQVKAGNVSSVGINPGPGFTRVAIGAAYGTFMANDPLGQDFGKLRYNAATPHVFHAPVLPAGQFNAITAPKDWLANQLVATANTDSLATFWDTTIDNFFRNGNTLSIYLGKEPTAPVYSGSSDGTRYTLSNGLTTYHFPKPTPTGSQTQSLANALYVWSQPNPGDGDRGLLQDQIWQALCRGVALDGVDPAPIDVSLAESTTFVKEGAANPQGVATITTASPHGLSTGASVNISRISNADYNGLQTITKVDDTTFTFPYTFASGPAAVITSATSTFDEGTGMVTVTIATNNGLWQAPAAGQIVYVELTSGDPSYSGIHTISEVDVGERTFKYTFAGSAALNPGVGGTVWGPLWSSGTGGSIDAGGSSTAWNDPTQWYTQHVSTAFPSFQSVYCPYSKFLHYSTLQGAVDRTGTTSIYLHNAAYGFGEDENPIGNPYTGPLVPSKLDGTVYDDSTVTIRLAPWTGTVSQPMIVSGDFNGDGLTDIASGDATSGLWQATLTPGNPADAPTTVPMTTWSTKFTYADISVGDFNNDGKDDIVGRASNGVWWLLADTGSGYANTNIGRWRPDVAWVDVVVGNFDGDPQGQSDVAGRTPDGMWWMLHDNGSGFVNQKLARWSSGVTWSDIVVGNFDGAADGRDEIVGRNSKGAWWMLTYDSAWKNQRLGGWSTKQQWADVLAGRFDDSGRDTIAGRTAADAWWLLTYDASQSAFTNVRMGAWSGSVDGWASVVRGDFDGNGFDDVAGRSLNSGSWTVTGLVSGSFQTKIFGGSWPTSSAWNLAFAGLYDTASVGPPKKSGILGRSEAGTWVRSLSDGSSFTTAAVTGYP